MLQAQGLLQFFGRLQVVFVPNGKYYCFLINVGGKGLRSAVNIFLQNLAKEKKKIQGNIFIIDVINNFITSNPENYCTMIYARQADEDK